jgi:hypothetical protein
MDHAPPSPTQERRRIERARSDIPVSVREVGRHRMTAQVTSFSRLGCGLGGATVSSGEGMIWVRLPGLESQPAHLRWTAFGNCGIEFKHPLHPAVASRFHATPSEAPYAEPADRLALSGAEADRPSSRREQIMLGHVEHGPAVLQAKRPRGANRSDLSTLIHRHKARISDHRLEPRYPAPAEVRQLTIDGRAVSVIDLSSSGVRLGSDLPGTIGDGVPLAFPGCSPILATIVWTGNATTGLALPQGSLDLIEAS